MTSLYKDDKNRFILVKKNLKFPLEQNWTTYNNYSFRDKKVQDWISEGGNIGIATGFNNILVVDFDDEEFQKEFLPKLPKTLMQRSGSGGMHLFYKTVEDSPDSFKILNKDKKTLADIQAKGRQIIVSPSIHPNGKQYEFINDETIAEINVSELKYIFHEYLNKKNFDDKTYNGEIRKPSLISILSQYGVDTSKHPTSCPWHASKGGKCFSFNESKGVWNCFHCDKSGDVIRFIEEDQNCDFKEACEILGIELKKPAKEIMQKFADIKVELSPELMNNPDEIGKIIGGQLASRENLFYRPYLDQLVEVFFIRDTEQLQHSGTKIRISVVDSDRLTNLLLKHICFYKNIKVNGEYVEKPTLLSKQFVKQIMKNDVFLEMLKPLERVMSSPFFFLTKNGLKYEYKGYSDKTHNLYTPNTPHIQDVSVDESKEIMKKILTGFCFEDESDREIALSYILTPALRGLYKDKRERTPCFALIANRERAGKDYLAGIRSIIYTGMAIDHPPLADGEKANVDEWRKKFTSILMNGSGIFHSANNVGYLNNPVFEALITSKTMEDRLLGSNTQKSFDNCLDMSFSANLGLKWRGDMSGRLRKINLFYADEDPNSREFPIPNLQEYILENRGYILSCIYALIKDWYEKETPYQNNKVFTSFPIWAKMCGGLMQHHELGNPLIQQFDDDIGGNEEERIMGAVFELMYRWMGNEDKMHIKSADIIDAIQNFQSLDDRSRGLNGYDDLDDETLMQINIEKKGDKLKIGHMITRFKGRIMRGIKFKILQQNKEAKRRIYTFEMQK